MKNQKTALLFFILFMLNIKLFSQKRNYSIEYNRLINKAELKICDSSYHSALKIYKKVFKKYQMVWAKDYYNALVCAYKLKDYKGVKKLLPFLAQKGISFKFFEIGFENSVDTILLSEFKNIHTQYFKKFDSELEKGLRLLLRNDQRVRDSCIKINSDYYAQCYSEIRQVDSINFYKLSAIMEKHLLSEDETGIIAPNNSPIYYFVLLHNTMYRRKELMGLLRDRVLNNLFSPQLYTFLSDQTYQNDSTYIPYGSNCALVIQKSIYFQYYTNENQIDSVRSLIGLESLEHFRKKAEFQFNNKNDKLDFMFIKADLMPGITGLDEKTENSIIRGFLYSKKRRKIKKNDTNTN